MSSFRSTYWIQGAAHAAAPVEQAQVPGFYRQQVGQAVVTAVYDGYVELDPKGLAGLGQQQIQQQIARAFQAKDAAIQTAVNAFVVRIGSHLVLIDSGSADCFGPTMGRMRANLKAAGFRPEDVDTILLTHMHPDHTCGITAPDGKAAFPNATVWASSKDAEKLLVWGDIVHFHAVQLPHPEVTIEVDVEPKGAVASRKRILAETARSKWLVAAAHHPFPGLGHVRSEGKGYAWVPVEYGDLPAAAR